MKRIRIVVIVIAACLSSIAVSAMLSAHALSVGRYTLSQTNFTEPVRIVQLTDLHNSEFGHGNVRLIRKVAELEPDLILITGDLLNANEERTDIAEDLIQNLRKIAPVFVSFGNHELVHERTYGTDLRSLYADAGATVLNFDYEDLKVNGQNIRLGGVYGYCLPEKYENTGEARKDECDFLRSFQDTEDYCILLCHMPVSWIQYGSLESWNVDCVLSGHVHGGQVRLPFVGGLWAPDQGWFPGQECGLYWSQDNKRVMVLSRGLGNTDQLPRLNNIPEILVLDMIPTEE